MKRPDNPKFVGVDGEGTGDGYDHAYYVLRAGDQQVTGTPGQPLTSEQCLDFLSRLDFQCTYVIYSGNYDFTMILRGLPEDVVRSLLDRKSREFQGQHGVKHHPVQWGDYKLEYLPHKNLTIRYQHYPPVEIHDVFSFFQKSFLTAVRDWRVATQEEYDIIEQGKNQRSTADVLSEESLEYNRVECVVLARLMREFDRCTRKIGLSAFPYEGPGAIAASALNRYVGQPHRKRGELEKPPQPPDDMPYTAAYYGGRFEITAHGPIWGDTGVHEYDIVSAYPHAMADLPCVWHSRWVHEDLPDAKTRLGHIRWSPNPGRQLAPFPVRNRDGSVIFPLNGAGWYWQHEWAEEWPDEWLHGWDIYVDDVWSLAPECDCKPYAWINNLFQARKQYKARGEVGPTQVLKLAYNSLYGKMAQSIGAAPWQNLAYAGMVTSCCRARMYQAAIQAPDDIVMVATDGIYSLSPLELDEGTELGQWEHTVFDEMTLVRPGIYFTPDGAKTKTRGINVRVIEEAKERIISAFDAGVDDFLDRGDPGRWTVPLEFPGLVSIKLAYSQNRPRKAGYFGTLPYSLSYDPRPKRVSPAFRAGILRSSPPTESALYESVAYTPRYSDTDETADVTASAPDRVDSPQLSLF
jgi:hypothetical protein